MKSVFTVHTNMDLPSFLDSNSEVTNHVSFLLKNSSKASQEFFETVLGLAPHKSSTYVSQ